LRLDHDERFSAEIDSNPEDSEIDSQRKDMSIGSIDNEISSDEAHFDSFDDDKQGLNTIYNDFERSSPNTEFNDKLGSNNDDEDDTAETNGLFGFFGDVGHHIYADTTAAVAHGIQRGVYNVVAFPFRVVRSAVSGPRSHYSSAWSPYRWGRVPSYSGW